MKIRHVLVLSICVHSQLTAQVTRSDQITAARQLLSKADGLAATGKPAMASAAYHEIYTKYPATPSAPIALKGLASAMLKLGKEDLSCKVLVELKAVYPEYSRVNKSQIVSMTPQSCRAPKDPPPTQTKPAPLNTGCVRVELERGGGEREYFKLVSSCNYPTKVDICLVTNREPGCSHTRGGLEPLEAGESKSLSFYSYEPVENYRAAMVLSACATSSIQAGKCKPDALAVWRRMGSPATPEAVDRATQRR